VPAVAGYGAAGDSLSSRAGSSSHAAGRSAAIAGRFLAV